MFFLYFTLYPLLLSADNLCEQFWTQIRPDKMSGLIWIQTVWHPDGIEISSMQRVKYGIIIMCEGIIKAMFENPKMWFLNHLDCTFRQWHILNHLDCTFRQWHIFLATLHFSSKCLHVQWLMAGWALSPVCLLLWYFKSTIWQRSTSSITVFQFLSSMYLWVAFQVTYLNRVLTTSTTLVRLLSSMYSLMTI